MDQSSERSCFDNSGSPPPGSAPGPPREQWAEHPTVTAEGEFGGGGGGAPGPACKTPPWLMKVSRRGGMYNSKIFI